MKIAVYLEEANVIGGIEIFAQRHMEELRAAGHEVVQFKMPGDFSAFDEVIVHKCSRLADLESLPADKVVYYVHDHEPICPRTYAYTPFGVNCKRSSSFFPCIFCACACRGWKAALRRVFAQNRRKEAMRRFKSIVVISNFMKGRLVANGIPAGKIEVKPPKIAIPASDPATDEATPKVDLLYVGQLIRGKGVQLLIAALARMKRKRTLAVVGTGNMKQKLKELASRLGVADRVEFMGFQTNPARFMRKANCVVVPSFWQEPFGLVAAEAVALGKKTVVFDIGGLAEASSGRAILVPPGDVAALAKVLDEA